MFYMKRIVKFDRVILNTLFYIFYVLLVSLIFSFTFPLILVYLWKNVINPNSPIFSSIQISIIILVFIFTIIYRKFFYLPIFSFNEELTSKIKDIEKVDKNIISDIKSENSIDNKVNVVLEKSLNDKVLWEFPWLDIKIGKEIK